MIYGITIIENEKLNIGRINYHYSYFYKEQCNIEFDEEYISLFSKLKCFITIICSKDEWIAFPDCRSL